MSQTIRSHSESCERTPIFKAGDGAQVLTTTTVKVYRFEAYLPKPVTPANSTEISDLVESWGRDPARREALVRARAKLSRMTSGEAAESIRSLRLSAGLSQTDLAKALGTSQPHVARIENGAAQPTLDTCRKLARVLRVDLNAIGRALPQQSEEAI